MQRRRGALEFHGGLARPFADWIGFGAMTLGHVIIGRDPWCLDFCREHEQAHVRQVERWGFAFIPAYLLASRLGMVAGRALLFRQLVRARRAASLRRIRLICRLISNARRAPPQEQNPMHQAAHVERHFTASELVRDIVIGMSDGLTVPFALAAGLSGIAPQPRRSSSRPGSPRSPPARSPWDWGATWRPRATPSTTSVRRTARKPRSSPSPRRA